MGSFDRLHNHPNVFRFFSDFDIAGGNAFEVSRKKGAKNRWLQPGTGPDHECPYLQSRDVKEDSNIPGRQTANRRDTTHTAQTQPPAAPGQLMQM